TARLGGDRRHHARSPGPRPQRADPAPEPPPALPGAYAVADRASLQAQDPAQLRDTERSEPGGHHEATCWMVVGHGLQVVGVHSRGCAVGALECPLVRKRRLSSRALTAWADVFWFSLFHEIGHVLLDDRSSVFIEEMNRGGQDLKNEAVQFAADELI